MGSFDVACAISGIPIRWQTPVRYMLLVQNQFYCAGVRPHSVTAEWAPLTPPLRGVYEDRGAVSSLSTVLMAKSWRRYLAECLVETSFPKACPRVRPVPSLRRILEAVRGGRLTVQHEEEDAVPLHVAEALIRDDVWNSLLTVKSPFFGMAKRSPQPSTAPRSLFSI